MKHPNIQLLIAELKKTAHVDEMPVWKRVASDLSKPSRQRRTVNLSKISSCSQDNDLVIVPGKVLADGELTPKVTIAAYSFSKSAQEKIALNGSKAYLLADYLKANPKPKNAKLLG